MAKDKKNRDIEPVQGNPMDKWLPQKLRDTTINDLLQDPDIEFRGGKGSFTMRRNFEGNRLTIRVDKKANFQEVTQSVMDADTSREERDALVRSLRKQGRTQQEIADVTGISQPGVSYILRKEK